MMFFLVSKPSYSIRLPTGSVLSTTLNMAKEAVRKSHRPSLTNSFVNHWLDRAKICFGGSYSSSEVEDVKTFCRLLPVFATLIFYKTVVYGQLTTSMIYQGEYMDITLGNFKIPIASLSVPSTLGTLILIPFMDRLVYPLLAKFDIRLSQLQRIGVGMIISTASMACAGGIEWYRVEQCCILQDRGDTNLTRVSSITILFQIPQYTLLGLSDVFTTITALEFAYTEAPKSLQGVIMGVHHLTTGLGTYFGAILVLIVNVVTEAIGGPNKKWYPDKDQINDGHFLSYYFFFLAFLTFLNFILYIFVALSFKARKEAANSPNLRYGNTNAGIMPDITSKP